MNGILTGRLGLLLALRLFSRFLVLLRLLRYRIFLLCVFTLGFALRRFAVCGSLRHLLGSCLTALFLRLLAGQLRCRNTIGVDVYRGFAQLKALGIVQLDGFAHQRFNVVELVEILLGNDGKRPAYPTATARAANAMDIIHRIFRNIEVDNIVHVGDVDAARQHIGGNQHVNFTRAERMERTLALALRAVSVDNRTADIGLHQTATACIGTMLGAGEHDNALRACLLQDLSQQSILRFQGNGQRILLYRIGSGGYRGNLDASGALHQIGNGANFFLVERGREQQGLARFGGGTHNGADGRQEAHVEHTVGFVEHQSFHLVERTGALLHQIDQAARGGDKDVTAPLQRIALRVVAQATHNGNGRMLGVLGNSAAHLFNLLGKLAGRRYHQQVRAAPQAFTMGTALFAMRQVIHRGQEERCGFAGTRLGGSQNIAAFQHFGNGLCLNGRRCGVSQLFYRLHNFLIKPQGIEA